MARIRRGGERTAGRTRFSWVGLGWVGITSAIDLITPCGPRCLLVSVLLSLSIPLLVLTLSLSSPSGSPRVPPVSVVTLAFFLLLPRSLSSLPRVPSPRVTSRFFPRRFLHLCLCRLFARFLSPFRSYFLAPASSSPAVFRALPPFPSPSLHRHAALHPGTFPFSLLAAVRRSTTRPSYLSSATHTRCVTAACSWMLIFRRIISPGEENLKYCGSYDAPSWESEDYDEKEDEPWDCCGGSMTHMREISSRSRSWIFLALPARLVPAESSKPYAFLIIN